MQGIHPVFHVSVLHKHKPNQIAERERQTPEPVTVENREEWEVNEVLDFQKKGQMTEYLVSWKGFGAGENSWEPLENLEHCGDLVVDFNARFPEAISRYQRMRRRR